MRIRKRQVPLPLSSLLPVPLSDLYFHRSSPPPPTDDGAHQPPSDLSHRLIRRWTIDDSCGFHGARDDGERKEKEKALGDDNKAKEEESDEVGSKNADAGQETGAVGNTSRDSNSPSQVVERWSSDHEGDEKVAPLKKRRAISSQEASNKNGEGEMDNKSEAKEDGVKDSGNAGSTAWTKGRKKARGGAIAEGSRCSRVNGRGWRCCQQTLVGYSLCEHHLGKGRLRSKEKMIRQSNLTKNSEKKKKKVKLGVVKARSMSSLLGGTQIVAPTDHSSDDVV